MISSFASSELGPVFSPIELLDDDEGDDRLDCVLPPSGIPPDWLFVLFVLDAILEGIPLDWELELVLLGDELEGIPPNCESVVVLLGDELGGNPPDCESELVLLVEGLEGVPDAEPGGGAKPASFWARRGPTSELRPLKLLARSMSSCEYWPAW
jgi:hypothetical protein